MNMCQLCNGTYVVIETTNYSASFGPCPECGPEPPEIWEATVARIKEARIRLGLEVKG